jgi:hypothetical protein
VVHSKLVDEAYFREKIVPLLSEPGVEFIGEIRERSKTKFLGDALALTPLLAFRHGSV